MNNSVGVSGPSPVNLTITDDDAAPTVALVLDVHSISEAGGIAEVSARLDRPSSAVTTVTVSATPVFPAVPGDFVQRGSTLTIAAGSKASTGSVTIEGVDKLCQCARQDVDGLGNGIERTGRDGARVEDADHRGQRFADDLLCGDVGRNGRRPVTGPAIGSCRN